MRPLGKSGFQLRGGGGVNGTSENWREGGFGKRVQLTGHNRRPPQSPTETDPGAPEVTRTHNSAKKMKMGLLESARRGGSEKSSFAMYLVKKKMTIYNSQKVVRRLW